MVKQTACITPRQTGICDVPTNIITNDRMRAVPLLHRLYRDTWVSRPGHTNDSNEQRVEAVLAEVVR